MSAILPAEILKPSKHGFVIDMQDGERRIQVRVFEFENQQIMPGNWCEMPVTIDEGQAIARLRQGMECLREAALTRGMTNEEGRMRNEPAFGIPHSGFDIPPQAGGGAA